MAFEEGGGATVAALEQLYRSRYQRFLRLALALVGSREAAADVVQEAFARALRSRLEFRGEGSLESWVWRTVINLAHTHNQHLRPAFVIDSIDPARGGANGHAGEQWAELRAAVAALPERQRHALFLRHYADLSYEEIAEVLEVARGTVSATLHAAHATLARTLEGALP
jgi:RNA polymerase sigma-70 factor (ECF subfamily)